MFFLFYKHNRDYLLTGLEKIQTRGYDGAGIATMGTKGGGMVSTKSLVVYKSHVNIPFPQTHFHFVWLYHIHFNLFPKTSILFIQSIVKKSSPDDKLDPIQMVRDASHPVFGHSIGIAHTRWATHGSITDRNAHPHLDASGNIAVVHNGSILNKQVLRKELKALGYKFEGQTDTEVIAKLIGHYYDRGKVDIREATEKAMKRCEGAWGLVVMCSDLPEELVVTSNGSPLYIGVGDEGTFVASNPSAFKGVSRNFIKLDDREVATITVDGRNLDLTKQISHKHDDEEKASPAPYPHFYIKE